VKPARDIAAFARRIGHDFADAQILIEALTHASIVSPTRPDNQRLEFLGDRVLGLAIAEALLATDPAAREGDLAPRFNALVRRETCAEIAREIGLGEALRLGRSEMITGGRRKEALLADALEAVIAAVYVDAGFDAARDLVRRLWGGRIAAVAGDDARDAKSTLQAWAQARGLPPPDYAETGREGPPHEPVFTIEVRLADGTRETAAGRTKRQAEQDAAQRLLARIGAER
jgi:ribonuclease-3